MSGVENQVSVNHKNANENSSLLRTAAGIAAGSVTGSVFLNGAQFFNDKCYSNFLKEDDKFTSQDREIFIDEAEEMVKQSRIKERGFKQIVLIDPNKGDMFWDSYYGGIESFKKKDLNPEGKLTKGISPEEAFEKMKADTKEAYLNGPLSDRLTGMFAKATKSLRIFSQWLYGIYSKPKVTAHNLKTGAFNFLTNEIYSGRPSSLLHEVGHAINKNGNQLEKAPSRLHLISSCLLIPLVVINAMFTKKTDPSKKTNNDQKDNTNLFKKIRDFTHKHIGLTAAGLLVPMLVEEYSASLRAVRFVKASKNLSENVKKHHNKALKLAFGTYLILTLATSVAIKLSVLVKDKVVAYKKKKDN